MAIGRAAFSSICFLSRNNEAIKGCVSGGITHHGDGLCGGLSLVKEAELSELQLFKIFGRGGVVSVCALWLTCVKAFPNPILLLGDLIGSFLNCVGLP